MSAGIHPTITFDLASSTIGERHRTAQARARRVTARRARGHAAILTGSKRLAHPE